MAAIAGALVGPLVYVSVGMGGSIGITGFAAAILGGFGNIPGAIVGGLVFGLIQSYAQGSDYGAYTDVITFVIFTARDHDPADWAARRADGRAGREGRPLGRPWRAARRPVLLPFAARRPLGITSRTSR